MEYAADSAQGLLALALIAGAYLLPTVIAALRRHHQAVAIGAVNILLGWTALGWIVAFVWSLTARRRQPAGD